jgi:ABC-2 type transport system ATP-binding protein
MSVEVRNVYKSFSDKKVLSDISLAGSPGEILCLLGPSGAGKTTLIRLIIGAISPDAGIISVCSRTMPDIEAIRKIGYMPQNDAVYGDISGLDNLMFFGRAYGLPKQRLRQRALDTLQLLDLYDDRDKLVSNYSGGMKKRLSLAVALLHEPEVLLLDEPTVGIDPVLRKTIWDKFSQLCSGGRTIIITTHVMDEAERCQKAALIYGGRLIECGSVGELRKKTKNGSLEELFFLAGGEAKAV